MAAARGAAARLREPATPDRHRDAFLLGLLLEGDAAPDVDAEVPARIREEARRHLAHWLEAIAGAAGRDERLSNALLYLLAHFPEDRALIEAAVARAFGGDHPAARTLAGIFAAPPIAGSRGRAMLMYLGAEACDAAGGNQLALAEQALACPVCRGPLAFTEAGADCRACRRACGYRGGFLDLAGDTDAPEEFSPDRAATFERDRHRFVRVMARDFQGHLTREREEAYLARHLPAGDGPVLDLACGAGSRTALVARHTGRDRLIGLDYSVPMLEACAAAVPDALFVRGDAAALPIGDGALAAINCSDALQALPDPGRALMEASRCLRPGGRFTCFTFRESAPPYLYFQHRFPVDPRRTFSIREIEAFVEEAGLTLIDMREPRSAVFFTAEKR